MFMKNRTVIWGRGENAAGVIEGGGGSSVRCRLLQKVGVRGERGGWGQAEEQAYSGKEYQGRQHQQDDEMLVY